MAERKTPLFSKPTKVLIITAALAFILIIIVAALPKKSEKIEMPAVVQKIEAGLLPRFQVVGRTGTSLAVVVPEDTSRAALTALINEFRIARQAGSLSGMIPATTPGSATGNYGVVWIFFFTEHRWATAENIAAFVNSKTRDKEMAENIKAEYYYSSAGEEYGNLGCRDLKASSPCYEYLF